MNERVLLLCLLIAAVLLLLAAIGGLIEGFLYTRLLG